MGLCARGDRHDFSEKMPEASPLFKKANGSWLKNGATSVQGWVNQLEPWALCHVFLSQSIRGVEVIEWLNQHLVSRWGQPTTERHSHVLILQYRHKNFPQKIALQALPIYMSMLKEIALQLCFLYYYVLSPPITPSLCLAYPTHSFFTSWGMSSSPLIPSLKLSLPAIQGCWQRQLCPT